MEEVGPDNEIGLDDVNGGNVVDVLDGGYIINDRRSLSSLPSSARGLLTASQWRRGRAILSVSTR